MITFSLNSLYLFFFVFLRTGALFFFIPAFSGRVVPVRLRIALALLIAVVLTPLVELNHTPSHFVAFIGLAFAEVFLGLFGGLIIRSIFFVLEFAAQVISSEMGLAMSAGLSPVHDGGSSTSVGNVLFCLGVLIFFALKLDQITIYALLKSFSVVGAGTGFLIIRDASQFVRCTAHILELGVQMAAPILAINFIVNLTFSVLGKSVPKMNVFMTSFAVRIVAGLSIFFVTLGLLKEYIVEESLSDPELMLQIFQCFS